MLNDFINTILSKKVNVFGIVVIKDGVKAPRHHFKPETRRNLYSATKSFTGTSVGIAIAEGYFSLNDSILKFFEGDVPKTVSKNYLYNLNKVTVERLLTINTGILLITYSYFWTKSCCNKFP